MPRRLRQRGLASAATPIHPHSPRPGKPHMHSRKLLFRSPLQSVLRTPGISLVALLPCLAPGQQAQAQQATDTKVDEILGKTGLEASTPLSASLPANWAQNLPGRIENPSLGTGVFPTLPTTPAAEEAAAPVPGAAPGPTPPFPLHWGSLSFHPHLAYSLLYGTGIAYGPGRQDNTFLNTVSPGLTFGLGPRWSLDYTPSLLFYSSQYYSDTLDHAVSLRGSASAGRWDFSFGYGYRSTSDPLIETATQTDQETHNANVGANCRLGEKTSLELNLAQALRFAQAYADSYTWSTTDWLDYQVRPTFAVAGGIDVAYDLVDPGTDMTRERLLGRVRGQMANKLSYSIQGGVEFRQFLDTQSPAKISPNVDASLNYQLFEPTSVFAFISHDTGTSYYSDQFTETTRMGGGFRQRFLGKVFLDVNAGYTIQKYSSTFGDHVVTREDDYPYFQAGLNTRFLTRGGLSVFYRYNENASDVSGYSFTSNQVGLQLSYAL